MENMRYKEAFLLMDQTNAGVISVNDVHLLIRALGFTPTQADLDGIDRDLLNGGDVDYLWFVDVISRMSCTQYTYEQVKNAFYAFDKNRYGLISVESFKAMMTGMGEPLSDVEMNEMLKDLPVDDDGFIEYEYFCERFKPQDDMIVSQSVHEEKK